jgi:N-acylneuraminate cytidylyltransferase
MDRMVTRSAEVIAIVPARGGSKSIPRKNIRPFGGHPLIAWSIAAAQHCRWVQRIVVSTDDEEIAAVARNYGAETPFMRPAELAQDDTLDLPVFRHALDWLWGNEGYRPDLVIQLRPTSPLRPRGLLDNAVRTLLLDEAADSVRSVTPPSQNPFKMWSVRDGALAPILPSDLHEPYNAPRQSLPATFWQTGHVDAIRTSTIQQKNSMSGDRILPVFVDSAWAADIDEFTHWRLAEEGLREGLDVARPGPGRGSAMTEIRLVVFDFDGVFTDNQVYVNEDGAESVNCSRADGLGIARLHQHGIDAAVLSTEENPVVAARCNKLKLPVRQGLSNKAAALRELAGARGLNLAQVAFVGNDLNDMECLQMAGLSVAPADAHPLVRRIVDIVLEKSGGRGAVREVCELAVAAQNEEGRNHASSPDRESHYR